MAVKNCFIRGSVVRYVQLPAEHIDTQLLEDATRRGASQVAPSPCEYLRRPNFRGNQSKQTLTIAIVLAKVVLPKSFNMVRFSVVMKTRPILQNKILILRIWVPPYLRRPIGTGSDHLACISRMMFSPQNKFFMGLRRRVWL